MRRSAERVGECEGIAAVLALASSLLWGVAVLGSLYPAVTVLLARVVHGERLRPAQNVRVTTAPGGVLLITAG